MHSLQKMRIAIDITQNYKFNPNFPGVGGGCAGGIFTG